MFRQLRSESFEGDLESVNLPEALDSGFGEYEWEQESRRRRASPVRRRVSYRPQSSGRPGRRPPRPSFPPPRRPRPPHVVVDVFPSRPWPPPGPPQPPDYPYLPTEPAPAEPGSESVRWLQSTLNRVMGLRLPVDGIMGPETRSTIRDFQRREGLLVDGIVGPETKQALMAARKRLSSAVKEFETFDAKFTDEIWEGEVNRSSRDYVRWVQQALNRILGLRLAVDGIIGSQTRSAVRTFQERHGLTVDGIVGSQTEQALIRAGAGNPPGVVSSPYVPPSAPSQPSPGTTTSAQLARQIINSGRVSFLTYHSSGCGKGDRADANSNINDSANGRAAGRSGYDCSSSLPAAPGGSVYLNDRMLNGMLNLSQSYTFRVTEIAGGQHNGNSRHYAGIAFDVDLINGVRVNSSNPHYQAFMQRCRALGATEVLGPGSAGHSTHIHCAWPRP